MDTIRTDNLTKRFGDLTAVDRLTLTVAPGELFGLVGSDGAGKTTTLRMLAGIMDPSDGEALVLGRHTVREVEAIRGDIGYMSQRFGLYPDLTVLENIHFYADIFGLTKKERDERLERLLAFSNLTPFKKRRAGNLSGGMKQKLGLACALIHTPRLLLLDEPTNGVDPVSRRDFWRILYQLLREGVTIVVATAYLDEAERCNRVGLIHQGRLVACAPPQELKRLMNGTILEVATPLPRKAGLLLRERLTGVTVGLFGDRLHVVTNTPDTTEAAIDRLFAQEQLASPTIRTIEPSLEDVFVSVLGNSHATDQPTV
ncbi:ABC transporter ATP-binding protein [Geobacter argillaceus]|uniref:ABC-2 type transport system ATP-binding protein n=1 Tax=Geobacter argillaceus TaxID=345631 RepID=A0A562V7K6_9BACT|nr:ABC transporter ATP-binding protein [Geobacter argillaceus]TWJ13871.1 ABC-2 type transport system ATP-binding protein [Geobacter argillaceus]